MNRAALTRLRQRIDVLRCPVCNRLAIGPELPVPSKDRYPDATTEELQEILSIFANAAERKVEVAPKLCQKCHRPPIVDRLELTHLSDDELNRLVEIFEGIQGRNPLTDEAKGETPVY